MSIFMGIDIGQKRDPTAIAVVEADPRVVAERNDAHFRVRHPERLPLGTPYQEVARQISELVARTGTHDDLVTALGLTVHADPLALASQLLAALAPLRPSGGVSETIR